MGIAVLMGYLVSAFFVFCGVIKMAHHLQHQTQMQDYAFFLQGLATDGWPLAVGTALYLLTQIAVQCEKVAVTGGAPVLLTTDRANSPKSIHTTPPPSKDSSESAS